MADIVNLATGPPVINGSFCPTPTAEAILRAARHCHLNGDMGMVVGSPGVGKTSALQHYVYKNIGASLCTMSPVTAAVAPTLLRIADALGTTTPLKGGYAIHGVLVFYLLSGGDKVLLIDEAQHVSDAGLEAIRSLHDETGVGVLLCGNRTFPSRFNGKHRAAYFAQFTSRIGMRLDLDESLPEDVTSLCNHYNVRGRRAHDFVQRHASRDGALRNAAKLIGHARAIAGDGNAVEYDHLKAAAELLWGMER